MSDWSKRQAEKIKEQAQTEQQQRQWELHRQKQIEAHWEECWRAIADAVRAEVIDFNGQFPGKSPEPLHLETPSPQELTVRRNGSPVRVIKVFAQSHGVRETLIESDLITQDRNKSEFRFVFEVVNGGGVGLRLNGHVGDHQAAAEAILKPLFP